MNPTSESIAELSGHADDAVAVPLSADGEIFQLELLGETAPLDQSDKRADVVYDLTAGGPPLVSDAMGALVIAKH
jgi:hypothetical protein